MARSATPSAKPLPWRLRLRLVRRVLHLLGQIGREHAPQLRSGGPGSSCGCARGRRGWRVQGLNDLRRRTSARQRRTGVPLESEIDGYVSAEGDIPPLGFEPVGEGQHMVHLRVPRISGERRVAGDDGAVHNDLRGGRRDPDGDFDEVARRNADRSRERVFAGSRCGQAACEVRAADARAKLSRSKLTRSATMTSNPPTPSAAAPAERRARTTLFVSCSAGTDDIAEENSGSGEACAGREERAGIGSTGGAGSAAGTRLARFARDHGCIQ